MMHNKPMVSNWILMVVYTFVLVLGIIAASFLLAFYWKIDAIARFDPVALDYSGGNLFLLAPLNAEVVASARRDVGDNANVDDPNPIGDRGQEPTLTAETATQTPQPSASPTATSLTPIPSTTVTQIQTETATSTLLPTETGTLEPTNIHIQKTPTQQPTKKLTNTSQPNPTATPKPRPTQPPPTATSEPEPTNTEEPYPPPRPYP